MCYHLVSKMGTYTECLFINFLNNRNNVISSDPSTEKQLSQYVGHFVAIHGYGCYCGDDAELPIHWLSHIFNNSVQY